MRSLRFFSTVLWLVCCFVPTKATATASKDVLIDRERCVKRSSHAACFILVIEEGIEVS